MALPKLSDTFEYKEGKPTVVKIPESEFKKPTVSEGNVGDPFNIAPIVLVRNIPKLETPHLVPPPDTSHLLNLHKLIKKEDDLMGKLNTLTKTLEPLKDLKNTLLEVSKTSKVQVEEIKKQSTEIKKISTSSSSQHADKSNFELVKELGKLIIQKKVSTVTGKIGSKLGEWGATALGKLGVSEKYQNIVKKAGDMLGKVPAWVMSPKEEAGRLALKSMQSLAVKTLGDSPEHEDILTETAARVGKKGFVSTPESRTQERNPPTPLSPEHQANIDREVERQKREYRSGIGRRESEAVDKPWRIQPTETPLPKSLFEASPDLKAPERGHIPEEPPGRVERAEKEPRGKFEDKITDELIGKLREAIKATEAILSGLKTVNKATKGKRKPDTDASFETVSPYDLYPNVERKRPGRGKKPPEQPPEQKSEQKPEQKPEQPKPPKHPKQPKQTKQKVPDLLKPVKKTEVKPKDILWHKPRGEKEEVLKAKHPPKELHSRLEADEGKKARTTQRNEQLRKKADHIRAEREKKESQALNKDIRDQHNKEVRERDHQRKEEQAEKKRSLLSRIFQRKQKDEQEKEKKGLGKRILSAVSDKGKGLGKGVLSAVSDKGKGLLSSAISEATGGVFQPTFGGTHGEPPVPKGGGGSSLWSDIKDVVFDYLGVSKAKDVILGGAGKAEGLLGGATKLVKYLAPILSVYEHSDELKKTGQLSLETLGKETGENLGQFWKGGNQLFSGNIFEGGGNLLSGGAGLAQNVFGDLPVTVASHFNPVAMEHNALNAIFGGEKNIPENVRRKSERTFGQKMLEFVPFVGSYLAGDYDNKAADITKPVSDDDIQALRRKKWADQEPWYKGQPPERVEFDKESKKYVAYDKSGKVLTPPTTPEITAAPKPEQPFALPSSEIAPSLEKPEVAVKPVAPVAPVVPGVPGIPPVPELTVKPEVAVKPVAPVAPVVPGVPGIPPVPELTVKPEVAVKPVVPGTPLKPIVPAIPELQPPAEPLYKRLETQGAKESKEGSYLDMQYKWASFFDDYKGPTPKKWRVLGEAGWGHGLQPLDEKNQPITKDTHPEWFGVTDNLATKMTPEQTMASQKTPFIPPVTPEGLGLLEPRPEDFVTNQFENPTANIVKQKADYRAAKLKFAWQQRHPNYMGSEPVSFEGGIKVADNIATYPIKAYDKEGNAIPDEFTEYPLKFSPDEQYLAKKAYERKVPYPTMEEYTSRGVSPLQARGRVKADEMRWKNEAFGDWVQNQYMGGVGFRRAATPETVPNIPKESTGLAVPEPNTPVMKEPVLEDYIKRNLETTNMDDLDSVRYAKEDALTEYKADLTRYREAQKTGRIPTGATGTFKGGVLINSESESAVKPTTHLFGTTTPTVPPELAPVAPKPPGILPEEPPYGPKGSINVFDEKGYLKSTLQGKPFGWNDLAVPPTKLSTASQELTNALVANSKAVERDVELNYHTASGLAQNAFSSIVVPPPVIVPPPTVIPASGSGTSLIAPTSSATSLRDIMTGASVSFVS